MSYEPPPNQYPGQNQPQYPPSSQPYGTPPGQPYQPTVNAPGYSQPYPPQGYGQPYPPQPGMPQPPGGFPPPQPVYPGSMPPPKRNNTALIIILSIVGVVVLLCAGIGTFVYVAARNVGGAVNSLGNSASTAVAQINATATADAATYTAELTSTPVSQATATTSSGGSGTGTFHTFNEAVKSGTWTVTVNSATFSKGTQYSVPKAGYTYLVLDVTAVNNDTQTQPFISFSFNIKDDSGQQYDSAFVDNIKTPDGDVAAGDKIRGQIAFEVPLNTHTFTLSFDPDFTSSSTVFWKLTV